MDYFDTVIPVLLSFSISVILCPIVIPFLKWLKFGQYVRDDGPKSHLKKAGTPTMGGLIILISVVVTSSLYLRDYPEILPVIFATVGFGLIGFLDDYIKIVMRRSLGLRAWQKLVLQLLVTIIFVYLTTETKYGKQIYAVGSNAKAARMTGIDVDKVKVSVFVIAGALVGLASFVWIAMNASADPATTGSSYEMYAIAAVVLGGISMSGGRGKMLGILFGAMSYTVIDKIIVALKMDSLINDAIKGIILIVVIMIQIVSPRIKEKIQKR